MRLREVIRQSETKPIETGKTSETMATLCNVVISLSCRNTNDICHWSDGYPLNIHICVTLLQSIFDIRDETLVLDEIDEFLELMKKTWSMLGITRPVHNLCFTWVLFHQYIVTSQMEPDLHGASHAMLAEVANDAKKSDREALYVKILTSTLASMQGWTEKRLLRYHDYFQRGNVGLIENLLPLAFSSSRIVGEDVTISQGSSQKKGDVKLVDSSGERVDYYIRASIKNAFSKTWNPKSKSEAYAQSAGELMKLAKDAIAEFFEVPIGITEDLVHDLAEGLEQFFKEYTIFVASCGSKQSYIPTLPPLTRCNRDSKFVKLLKKAMPCTASSGEDLNSLSCGALGVSDGHHPRPSTSRGTQRLYIRSGFDGSASGRTLASVLPSRPRADRRRFREFEEGLLHVRGRVDTGRGSG